MKTTRQTSNPGDPCTSNAKTPTRREHASKTVAPATSQRKALHLYTRFFAARQHDVVALLEMLALHGEAKRWRLEQAASKELKATGEPLMAKAAEDCEQAASAIEDKRASLNAQSSLIESSGELIQRMLKGDSSAAVALLRTAEQITSVLHIYYRRKPELFQSHAAFSDRLPVIASLRPGWVARAKNCMQSVRLGASRINSHLKRSAYKTANHPCRAWAAWALEVLELNRANAAMWVDILPYLLAGNRPDLKPLLPPAWVPKSCGLPELSKQTLPQWLPLAREMIRDQVPEFHDLPEFSGEMRRIKARSNLRDDIAKGKPLTGTLQTALLDKIANAMRSIVA